MHVWSITGCYQLSCLCVYIQFVCNTFSVYDTDLAPLAAAVYTTPSFINHSCVPNCIVVYTGRKLSLRTIQPIQAGDQLFISYTEQLQTYTGRKEELKKMYGFQCDCQRCRDDTAMSPVSECESEWVSELVIMGALVLTTLVVS